MGVELSKTGCKTFGFLHIRFSGVLGAVGPGLYLMVLYLSGRLFAADVPVSQPKPPGQSNVVHATASRLPDVFGGLRIEQGFRLELAATAPLVVNPGPMAFDENGRLFVIEMWDGSGNTDGSRGRVRVLEDADGDGVYDASSVYAKDLDSPTALIPYGGGVFVACGGDIIFLKDSKGDGQADVRREVFKGFGDATNGANGKVSITGMAWGLDNRIYVSTASRGGDVISSSAPRQSLILGEGCFSFDPRDFQVTAESGSAPAGMSFDDRGRRFVAGHSHSLELVMHQLRYAARNPYYTMPGKLLDIAGSGGATNFPNVRNILVYRGSAFPPGYQENIFAIDAAGSVAFRAKLRPNDVGMALETMGNIVGLEFLTCNDRSFQLTQLADAPDGTLYAAGVVSEPAARAGAAGANANLNDPAGRGRIYRIEPLNFKRPKLPRLGKTNTLELPIWLRHPNRWQRETVERLLYERQDKAALAPLVQLLYDLNSPPLGRVYALHALDGMGTLVPAHLARALNDPDDRVRENAVLLAEKFITNSGALPDILYSQFGRLKGDPSPQVRYQLAFTLGQLNNPGRVPLLADLIRSDAGSQWMQSAVLSSLGEGTGELFGLLAEDPSLRAADAEGEFLGQLAGIIGAKNQPEEVTQALRVLNAMTEPRLAFSLAQSLDDGLQTANGSLAAADSQGILNPLYLRAARLAIDGTAAEPVRVQAILLIAATQFADPQTGVALVEEWPGLSARLRSDAAVALLTRTEHAADLMWGMERGIVPTSDLSAAQVRFLLTHPDPIIRQRAMNVFENGPVTGRQDVVNRFLATLHMGGMAERGRAIFLTRCAACHRLGDDGNRHGLDLAGSAKDGAERLLVKILDPNREPSATSSVTVLETKQGQALIGFISEQTANDVVLGEANGVQKIVGRQNIKSMRSLNLSGMPEGLEAGLSEQDMADLIAYVGSFSAAD